MTSPSRIIRKISEYIQVFFWDLYWQGKLLTLLKHRGFSAFPITNMGSFLPIPFPAARPVKRILLYFPPAHCSPFRWKDFLEAVRKINQTHQHCKYLSIQRIMGKWVCSQLAVISTVQDHSSPETVRKTTCLFFHRSSHPSKPKYSKLTRPVKGRMQGAATAANAASQNGSH